MSTSRLETRAPFMPQGEGNGMLLGIGFVAIL
jgi:hypothetical protein